MKNKQLFVLMLFCLFSVLAKGQDYLELANFALEKGHFAEAIVYYKKYQILPASQKDDVSEKIKQAQSFSDLLKQADNDFVTKNYNQAKIKYEQIAEICTKYQHVKDRIAKCDEEITIQNKNISQNTSTANPVTYSPTYDKGVIINGVKWATRNVDMPGTFATKPEDAGKFYQWNRKKAWPTTGSVIWDSSKTTGTTWGTITDPCPKGWRVPTVTEIEQLKKTGHAIAKVNGVNGIRLGKGDNTIFLPAAGNRRFDNGKLEKVSYGYYWSNTDSKEYYDCAYGFFYSSGGVDYIDVFRNYGRCVRCVAEDNSDKKIEIQQPATGKIMIYSESSYLPIDIYIDDNKKGTLNSYFNGQPFCSQNGTITVEVSIGKHKIEASYNGYPFTQEVTVKGNDCIPVALEFSKIVPQTGKIIFYSTSSVVPIDIYVDDSLIGTISDYYQSGEPRCEDKNAATVIYTGSVGKHKYYAKYKGKNRSNVGFVGMSSEETIKGGDCIRIPLDFSEKYNK